MPRLFISCREAARRVSEQQDAPLSRSTRIGLSLHLAVCAHCRRYSQQIQLLHSALRDYPDRLSQMKLPKRARAAIVRELSGQF